MCAFRRQPPDTPPTESSYTAAVRLLARRAHNRAQLFEKLRLRGHASADINDAIAKLESHALIESEADLALKLAMELAKKRGATPRAVRHKLRLKGAPPSTIDAALEAAFSGWDPRLAAKQALKEEQNRKRAARKLERLGFPTEVIVEAVGQLPPTSKEHQLGKTEAMDE